MSLGFLYTPSSVDLSKAADRFTNETFSGSKSMRNLSLSYTRRIIKSSSNAIKRSSKFFSSTIQATPRLLIDTEFLYDENVLLKIKLNELNQENIELKQRLEEVEEQTATKNILTSKSLFRSKSGKIIPALKNSLKSVKDKLNRKEMQVEEIRKKLKMKKNFDNEGAMEEQIKQCILLKEKLIQALGIVNKPDGSVNYDDVIKAKEEEILGLRETNEDYFHAADMVNKELNAERSRILYLELIHKKKKKQKKATLMELKKLRSELLAVTQQREALICSHNTNLKNLQESVSEMSDQMAKNSRKLSEIEDSTQKKLEYISKTKRINTTYRNALKRARTMNVIEIESPKKLINPPKFFKKIDNIIKKKNLIIDVFLSLIDKNNKRMLTVEEAIAVFEPLKIKKRYILNALKIMGCSDKYVQVDKIQEWYEKYDYGNDLESLKSGNEKESEFNVNSPGVLEDFNIEEEKAFKTFHSLKQTGLTKSSNKVSNEFKEVFHEIAEKMRKLNIPKENLVEALLGKDFDGAATVFAEDIEKRILLSPLNLRNNPKISEFAKFLCALQSNVTSKSAEIAKRLMKYFHNYQLSI